MRAVVHVHEELTRDQSGLDLGVGFDLLWSGFFDVVAGSDERVTDGRESDGMPVTGDAVDRR